MDKKGELRVLFLVDLPRICYRDYSFIMVTYAKQVFYVKDPKNKRWYIIQTPMPK